MGLDAGLERFTFDEYEEELRLMGTDEYREKVRGKTLINRCGWDNPECNWLSNVDGFDKNNGRSAPLCPDDLYDMISAAIKWHRAYVKMSSFTITGGVVVKGENFIISHLDGVEGEDGNGHFRRVFLENGDNTMFVSEDNYFLDAWDIDKAMDFIAEINTILAETDWDNEIVVAYYRFQEVNMNYIKEYLFKADWYDDHRDKEETSYGLVMGKSYTDVMEKIEHRLPYANNIEINEYDETDFVWMNKCNYDRMKSMDNEIMFDFPDEEEKIIKCGQPSSNPKDRWPHPHEEALLKTVYGSDFDQECPYGLDGPCQDCPDYEDCKFADGGCDNDCEDCELNYICPNSLVDDESDYGNGPREYDKPWRY